MSKTTRRGFFGRIAAATGLAAVAPFVGKAKAVPTHSDMDRYVRQLWPGIRKWWGAEYDRRWLNDD